jgi:hypothetical protein
MCRLWRAHFAALSTLRTLLLHSTCIFDISPTDSQPSFIHRPPRESEPSNDTYSIQTITLLINHMPHMATHDHMLHMHAKSPYEIHYYIFINLTATPNTQCSSHCFCPHSCFCCSYGAPTAAPVMRPHLDSDSSAIVIAGALCYCFKF